LKATCKRHLDRLQLCGRYYVDNAVYCTAECCHAFFNTFLSNHIWVVYDVYKNCHCFWVAESTCI